MFYLDRRDSITAICTLVVALPLAIGVPTIDGTITSGEYDDTASFDGGQLSLHWSIVGDEVYFALQGQTSGWLALGLEPTKSMKDADMLMGWVSGGKASVLDAYSTGTFGPHSPDTDLGGTSDILAFGGSEKGGITTIELKRKLSTQDQYDKVIRTQGTVSIIWAIGSSDNYLTKHAEAGIGVISMAISELFLLGALASFALVHRGGITS